MNETLRKTIPILFGLAAGVAVAVTFAAADEPPQPPAATAKLETELRAAEEAFAKTMADRDHAAFTSFIADDAVFVGDKVLRGRVAVAAGWKRFFDGPAAPFSWKPDSALVLDSGKLGMTSGPVYDPAGKRVGTFQSTWRLEADGAWRVVLDRGCPPCACKSGG